MWYNILVNNFKDISKSSVGDEVREIFLSNEPNERTRSGCYAKRNLVICDKKIAVSSLSREF